MAKIVLKKLPTIREKVKKSAVRQTVSSSKELIQTLKRHRRALDISQAEVARLVNLNRQSVSNIERFEVDPQLSNIMEMLRVCGIKMVLEFTSSEEEKGNAAEEN